MTSRERHNSAIINGSRRKRIALGSGTSVQEVSNLLRQHTQMSKMMKSMGSGMMGGGIKAQQHLMSQMQGKQRFGRYTKAQLTLEKESTKLLLLLADTSMRLPVSVAGVQPRPIRLIGFLPRLRRGPLK
jgi:signal recognition particle GTPase